MSPPGSRRGVASGSLYSSGLGRRGLAAGRACEYSLEGSLSSEENLDELFCSWERYSFEELFSYKERCSVEESLPSKENLDELFSS